MEPRHGSSTVSTAKTTSGREAWATQPRHQAVAVSRSARVSGTWAPQRLIAMPAWHLPLRPLLQDIDQIVAGELRELGWLQGALKQPQLLRVGHGHGGMAASHILSVSERWPILG